MLATIRILVVVAAWGFWLGAWGFATWQTAANAEAPGTAVPNKPGEAAGTPNAPTSAKQGTAANAAAVGTDPDADYVDAVSDRFAAALAKQHLPYLTPVEVAALRVELHDYLKRRVKTPLVGPSRTELLKTIDKFVEVDFSGPDSYLNFRTNFDSLSWQLWTATERPELTAEALAERDRQREWMVAHIRDLPITQAERDHPELQHESRLRALKDGVFDNPLSPFFHEPMSAEEFDAFTEQFKATPGFDTLAHSPQAIFSFVVNARSRSLLRRWPPGLQHTRSRAFNGSATQNDFYYFNFVATNLNMHAWLAGPSLNRRRAYFNLASRGWVEQFPPLDAAATERWLSETAKGDIWYDAATRRLLTVHGAKMATLKETEWWAIDRLPITELRRRVREAPIESLVVPPFPDGPIPTFSKFIRSPPTVALENSQGTIVIARVVPGGQGRVVLQICYRPLPANPPFHPADEGYADPQPPDPSPELAEETPIVIDPDADFIDVVSDRFAAALARQKLPYVTPEAIAALRAEMHDYLKLRVNTPLSGPGRSEVLTAMDKFVQRKFVGKESYSAFRVYFDTLMWQLWTALDRRDLTADEHTERERQREFMRDYIGGLPETAAMKQFGSNISRHAQLKRLESEVFGNPLSPVFYDPMPADEFNDFAKQVEAFNHGVPIPGIDPRKDAPGAFFLTAIRVRAQSMLQRWPPGFRTWRLGGFGTQDFSLRGVPADHVCSVATNDGKRGYFDVATGQRIEQPPPLDAEATERWLAENKEGDFWFDEATRQLLPVHGAKMATLKETEWYEVDRIPIGELRKLVREAPVESVTIPRFSPPDSPAALQALAKLPTVVVESAGGKIVLLRAPENGGASSFWLHVHRRPLPPNLPFHPADEGYDELGRAPF